MCCPRYGDYWLMFEFVFVSTFVCVKEISYELLLLLLLLMNISASIHTRIRECCCCKSKLLSLLVFFVSYFPTFSSTSSKSRLTN